VPKSGDLLHQCPEIEELLRGDISTDEFLLKFQEKEDFLKAHYSRWRTEMESSLVKLLPKGSKPVETQTPDFTLTPHLNPLSMDLRVLLRADSRFNLNLGGRMHYYPETFDYYRHESVYDEKSSAVAKRVLQALGRPDASYLEMQGLGESFLCLRCINDPTYYTWDKLASNIYRSSMHREPDSTLD
jgi:hypothetical protein